MAPTCLMMKSMRLLNTSKAFDVSKFFALIVFIARLTSFQPAMALKIACPQNKTVIAQQLHSVMRDKINFAQHLKALRARQAHRKKVERNLRLQFKNAQNSVGKFNAQRREILNEIKRRGKPIANKKPHGVDEKVPNNDRLYRLLKLIDGRLLKAKRNFASARRRLLVLEKQSFALLRQNQALEKQYLHLSRLEKGWKICLRQKSKIVPKHPPLPKVIIKKRPKLKIRKRPQPSKVIPLRLPHWRALAKHEPSFVHNSYSLNDPQKALIPNRYFVSLDRNAMLRRHLDHKTITKFNLANELGIQPFMILSVLRNGFSGFVLEASAQQAKRIEANVLVDGVAQDIALRLMASSTKNVRHSHALDRIDQLSAALNGKFSRIRETREVRVYVIDSGIREDHLQIAGKVDFWKGFAQPLDGEFENLCNLHGTAMASLIAGKDTGVSRRVRLIDVNIVPCGAKSSSSGQTGFALTKMLEALDWIAGREDLESGTAKVLPVVVNISAAGPATWFVKGDPSIGLTGVFEKAMISFIKRTGVIIVAAAGNGTKDGAQDACTLFPAIMPQVITVGALTHGDKLAPFSNFGDCVDIFAPGVEVTFANAVKKNKLLVDSGTSQATALVSGVVAHKMARGETYETVRRDLLGKNAKDKKGPSTEYLTRLLEFPGLRGRTPENGLLNARVKTIATTASVDVKYNCLVRSPDGYLVLRKKPYYKSRKLAKLPNLSQVQLLKFDGRWGFVKTRRGQRGWVATKSRQGVLLFKTGTRSRCKK